MLHKHKVISTIQINYVNKSVISTVMRHSQYIKRPVNIIDCQMTGMIQYYSVQ